MGYRGKAVGIGKTRSKNQGEREKSQGMMSAAIKADWIKKKKKWTMGRRGAKNTWGWGEGLVSP